jgi:hypothetical protein
MLLLSERKELRLTLPIPDEHGRPFRSPLQCNRKRWKDVSQREPPAWRLSELQQKSAICRAGIDERPE